jgi:hypothetical protein
VTVVSAIVLYWAVLILVVIELRRELGDTTGDGTRGFTDLRLYAALAAMVLAMVVLTGLRLHAGG